MGKKNLRRVPIVDKNGKQTTVLKKEIENAFGRGETDLERARRLRTLATPLPHQVRAVDAAKDGAKQALKGLTEFDVPELVAGGIGLSTAAVYSMRELRTIDWEVNKDLSRHFLARLADADFWHPIDGYKKALEPATIYRGQIDRQGLGVLSAKHDQIENLARGATSLGEPWAAEFYENLNKRLVQLVLEEDPAAKADEIAKELRRQKFSDKSGIEFRKVGWMPYWVDFYSADTQEVRRAHKHGAALMKQTAAALRPKK